MTTFDATVVDTYAFITTRHFQSSLTFAAKFGFHDVQALPANIMLVERLLKYLQGKRMSTLGIDAAQETLHS
jgi:hypothetical protein